MAKVNGAAMGGEIRGNLGGFVFGKGLSGPIIRAKGTVVKRTVGAQDNRRADFGYLSRKWQLLTEVQRATWGVYAENHPKVDVFGNPYTMSAMNAFMMCNAKALQMGESVGVTAPVAEPVATLATIAAVAGAVDPGDIDLTLTVNGTGAAGDYIEIETDPGHIGQAVAFSTSRYTHFGTVAGNLLVATITGLTELLYYNIRARYVSAAGQVTAWLYADATPKVTI